MPQWTARKTRKKKKEFLTAYRRNPVIVKAANDAAISPDVVNTWRKADKKFLQDFIEAEKASIDTIEDSAIKRAMTSDRLAVFFLRTRKKEIYGDSITIGIDMDRLRELVSQMLGVLQRKLPRACPHCKTELDLAKPIAEALLKESAKFDKSESAVDAV